MPFLTVLVTVLLYTLAAGTDGPILAFHFDGTTISEDGTTLTPQGSGFTYVAGVGGGQAAYFPGHPVFLATPPLSSLPSGNAPRSVAMWIQPAVVSVQAILLVWGTSSTDLFSSLFELVTNGGNAIAFDGQNSALLANFDLTAGAWINMAYTFDGSAVTLYANGVALLSSSIASSCCKNYAYSSLNTAANTALMVGGMNDWYPGPNFRGALDELLIYDRALSPVEVATLAILPSITPTSTPAPSGTPAQSGTPTLSSCPLYATPEPVLIYVTVDTTSTVTSTVTATVTSTVTATPCVGAGYVCLSASHTPLATRTPTHSRSGSPTHTRSSTRSRSARSATPPATGSKTGSKSRTPQSTPTKTRQPSGV